MAAVYRAHQPSMHRDVALKVIRLSGSPERDRIFSTRFQNEVRLIAQLEHPYILPVYSYGFENELAFLSLRLMRGTLEDHQNGEPLPIRKGIEVFLQVAQGLAYAHSRGVIHRDIKPSNVLLDDESRPYLGDFGLAKLVNSEAAASKSGTIMGTPAYMSPEQLRGDPIDFRADVYSMGCLLYEMLTGLPPFPPLDGDVIPVILKHLESPVPPPSGLNPNIPLEIDQVILKALEKNPSMRYASVRDMATAAAEASGDHKPLTLPSPASRIVNVTSTQPVPSRPRMLGGVHVAWVAVGLLSMVIVAAVLVSLLGVVRDAPVKFPPATILLGQSEPLNTILPSDAERIQAQTALGNSGFIAIIPCNTSSEYHAALTREMTVFARDEGLSTRTYDPDSDSYNQLIQIERAIADGARGLIICPLDMELLAPTFEQVKAQNIPIVAPASGLGAFGGVQILTDNYLLGRNPGAYLGERFAAESDQPARVVMLTYEDLPDLQRRAQGLIEGFREFVPDAQVVASVRGATIEWSQESIQTLIDGETDFNVILSINDSGAFGAINALEDAGFTSDQVMIAGVDAEILAQRYIREGNFLHVSIEVGRTVYARASIDIMILMLIGQTLPEVVTIEPGNLVTPETLADSNG
jgi:serine/threonine-protein kinase